MKDCAENPIDDALVEVALRYEDELGMLLDKKCEPGGGLWAARYFAVSFAAATMASAIASDDALT